VNGDAISTTSRKAASRPRVLERALTGVMNRRNRCIEPLFKIDATHVCDSSNEIAELPASAPIDRAAVPTFWFVSGARPTYWSYIRRPVAAFGRESPAEADAAAIGTPSLY
jgi:hypothetical protein